MRVLDLAASQDLVCSNLMCEKASALSCLAALAHSEQQTQPVPGCRWESPASAGCPGCWSAVGTSRRSACARTG